MLIQVMSLKFLLCFVTTVLLEPTLSSATVMRKFKEEGLTKVRANANIIIATKVFFFLRTDISLAIAYSAAWLNLSVETITTGPAGAAIASLSTIPSMAPGPKPK